jgi:hypothetical protein
MDGSAVDWVDVALQMTSKVAATRSARPRQVDNRMHEAAHYNSGHD